MTRVFQSTLQDIGARLRVLLIGAGHYPHAQNSDNGVPALADLSSVPPSILLIARRFIDTWALGMAAPLASIDLLLSDPSSPAGAVWTSGGVAGEVATGTALDSPTLANVSAALTASLLDSTNQDIWFFVCCGHGFWKGTRYFFLSDFGQGQLDPWSAVLGLDGLKLGMRQMAPRQQWMFFDCCSNIPDDALDALGRIGGSLIQPSASALARASRTYGSLSQFGMYSSTIGALAYGVANAPSRFCEMLVEAVDGSGAIRKVQGQWWVDDRGMIEAMRTYPDRIDPPNPQFYRFPILNASDANDRMRLRMLANPPTSLVIASSTPLMALKSAAVSIDTLTQTIFSKSANASGGNAILRVQVPALQTIKITANFSVPSNCSKNQEIFADLPMADRVEFPVP